MAAFIDWMSFRVPYDMAGRAPIQDGQIDFITPGGSREFSVVKSRSVHGSFEHSVQVRSSGDELQISGNPTKWLQGHNLFGCCDGSKLLVEFMCSVCLALELPVSAQDEIDWREGRAKLSRIDVTEMYRLPAGSVPGWIQAAEHSVAGGRQKFRGVGSVGSGSLYIGENSKRLTTVLYDKCSELAVRGHGLSILLPEADRVKLLEYSQDTLRVEVRMRSSELEDRGLRSPASWGEIMASELIAERLGRISMLDNALLVEADLADMPRRLLGAYHIWLAGQDMRRVYSRAQFYRLRRSLRDYGIDIGVSRPVLVRAEPEYACGAPLRSFLVRSLDVPEWSRGTGLLVA